MKILLIRMYPNEMTVNNYNVQEIGLAKAFIKKGHKCDILSFTYDNESSIRNIPVGENDSITNYQVNGKNFLKNCIYSDEIYSIIEKYDIVQSQEIDQIMNVKLSKVLGDKLYIYHGPYYNKFNIHNIKYYIKTRLFNLLYLNKTYYKKTFIFTKSVLAEKFVNKMGFSRSKTIGVGLDMDKFNNYNGQDRFKNLSESDEFKLLYVGRMEPRRNCFFLLDLLKNVNQKGINCRLLIVGKGKEEYTRKFFDKVKKMGLENKITYYDFIAQDELPYLYKKCDVFLLPTNYEIFGMVLLEAMYFGVPTITTFNGGSVTIMKDGYNGYICDSMEQWINRLMELYNNKDLRKEISENSINTIKDSYSWDVLADCFLSVYK